MCAGSREYNGLRGQDLEPLPQERRFLLLSSAVTRVCNAKNALPCAFRALLRVRFSSGALLTGARNTEMEGKPTVMLV